MVKGKSSNKQIFRKNCQLIYIYLWKSCCYLKHLGFIFFIWLHISHYITCLIWFEHILLYLLIQMVRTQGILKCWLIYFIIYLSFFFFWYKIHWAVKGIILMQWCKHALTCCSDLWQTFIVKLQNSSSQNLFAQHRVCHLLLLVHEENPVNTQKT